MRNNVHDSMQICTDRGETLNLTKKKNKDLTQVFYNKTFYLSTKTHKKKL